MAWVCLLLYAVVLQVQQILLRVLVLLLRRAQQLNPIFPTVLLHLAVCAMTEVFLSTGIRFWRLLSYERNLDFFRYTHCYCFFFPLVCFSSSIAYTASDGTQFSCADTENNAAAGIFNLEVCATIAKFDEQCGCPTRPDILSRCSICPSTGVQNPYVVLSLLFLILIVISCLTFLV
jgi:hypothetical protein